MSLINDMLKDLAKRESPCQSIPGLKTTQGIKEDKTGKYRYLILTGILFTVMLTAYGAFLYGTKTVNHATPEFPDTPPLARLDKYQPGILPTVSPVIIKPMQPGIELIPWIQTYDLPLKPYPGATSLKHTQKLKADNTASQNSQNIASSDIRKTSMSIETTMSQFRILLESGRGQQATRLLDESLLLFPGNAQLINARAQIYLSNKNPQAALQILQGSNSHDEIYLSLLAATYQQLKMFKESADVYTKLVRINPNIAQYWLGMAIAKDKTGNSKSARDAYLQALSKNTLNSSVVTFINQRLKEIKYLRFPVQQND
jgi:hypothetical protein